MSLRRIFAVLLCVPFLAACQGVDSPTRWREPEPRIHLAGADGHRLPTKINLTSAIRPRPGTGPLGTYLFTGGTDVALTFDDGPSPDYTPQLLALLRQHDIKATFCLVGKEAEAYPSLVQAIVYDGHTLCNHSWGHDFTLGSQSEDVIRTNLDRTNEAIRRAVPGAQIRYYRQPGGFWTHQVIAIAQSLGMRSLHWHVDPQDWKHGPETIHGIVASQTRPGSIVLLHDAGGNRTHTLTACKSIFPQLKARVRLTALP